MTLVYGYLHINILLKSYLLYLLEYEDCSVRCEGIYITVRSEYAYDRCVGYTINFNISGMLSSSLRSLTCNIPNCLLELITLNVRLSKRIKKSDRTRLQTKKMTYNSKRIWMQKTVHALVTFNIYLYNSSYVCACNFY